MADAELSNVLNRRQRINEELEEGKEVRKEYKFVNVYTEFHELSRREIKQYEQTFNRWVSVAIRVILYVLCLIFGALCFECMYSIAVAVIDIGAELSK